MEAVQDNNQLVVINRSLDVLKSAGEILKSNQDRSTKALAVGNKLLTELRALKDSFEGGDISREEYLEKRKSLDDRCNNYLANCAKAKKEENDLRSPVTQVMNMIIKFFTEQENLIDAAKPGSVPAAIQAERNVYAREQLQEQERIRKESEARAAKAKEEIEIRAYLKNAITQNLLDYLAERKLQITNSFNAITLTNFEEKSGKLAMMVTDFPVNKLNEIVKKTDVNFYRHTQEEYDSIVSTEMDGYDFKKFYAQYKEDIALMKQSLIDQLSSKKEELLEQKRIADEAETARQTELARQKEAEIQRRREMEKADAVEQKRLQAENERIMKEEKDRLARLEKEAEEKKAEAERQQKEREAAEGERLRVEAEEAKKKAAEESELQKAAGSAQLLFDQVAETSNGNAAPETRSGFDIKVTHSAGWIELITFWYQRQGVNLSLDELEKKTFVQIKTYAEGVAKKTGEKIDSKFLAYEVAIKSVNRKAVKA